ncbi:hypothetical protein BVC80_1671g25 [Macleaya cordata]|uniref:Uncharacterized protein n=1 Tax=Macleaya cordata TaxID=56857 RepID=A0A200PPR2_MACCD|nr:hypothetical protein BVC80_1671g25 [Macleaya cordata]
MMGHLFLQSSLFIEDDLHASNHFKTIWRFGEDLIGRILECFSRDPASHLSTWDYAIQFWLSHSAWEEASKAVKDEEAIKQKLCDDLNNLVQESSQSQYSRLEELKRRLEALNPIRASTSDLHDVKLAQSSTTAPDVPSNPQTIESAGRTSENARDQGNVPVVNGQSQQPTIEGEGRGKKKVVNPGRGKSGFVPKGRGSPGPGWTGAGFDVDGRT